MFSYGKELVLFSRSDSFEVVLAFEGFVPSSRFKIDLQSSIWTSI